MGVGRRQVEHDLDSSSASNSLGRRVGLRQAVLRRLASSLVEVAAGAADDADDVAVARQVGEVDVADVADPDDPDAERVHVLRAPRRGAPGGAPGAMWWRRRRSASPGARRAAVHGLGDLAPRDPQEREELGVVGRLEPGEERGPGGTGQHRGLRLQGADRRPPVEADRHRIPRADDLHPDVVAERVVAGLPEDREGAVGEREDGRAGVDVAVLARTRETRAPRPRRRPRRPPGRSPSAANRSRGSRSPGTVRRRPGCTRRGAARGRCAISRTR